MRQVKGINEELFWKKRLAGSLEYEIREGYGLMTYKE